jgi:hypothetical protein
MPHRSVPLRYVQTNLRGPYSEEKHDDRLQHSPIYRLRDTFTLARRHEPIMRLAPEPDNLHMTEATTRGKSFPLGATVYPAGVNFSVYSKSATEVQVLLFTIHVR